MCNDNNNRSCCTGIKDILEIINILQRNASCCCDNAPDTCDKGFLGTSFTPAAFNTRPVMLYTSNNSAWEMPTLRTSDCTATTTSCVFRVEKIEDCTATFRVLIPDTTVTPTSYTPTDSFFVMNLNCVCALRCLPDVCIEGVC